MSFRADGRCLAGCFQGASGNIPRRFPVRGITLPADAAMQQHFCHALDSSILQAKQLPPMRPTGHFDIPLCHWSFVIRCQNHGLWPCDPERLCRSGVVLLGVGGRAAWPWERARLARRNVVGHATAFGGRIVPLQTGFRWSWITELAYYACCGCRRMERAGRARSQGSWRSGSQGAFRYVVRPAVRGRPKPRLLAVVDYSGRERTPANASVTRLHAENRQIQPASAGSVLPRPFRMMPGLSRSHGKRLPELSNFASPPAKPGVSPETTNCSGSSCALWLAFCCRSARLMGSRVRVG